MSRRIAHFSSEDVDNLSNGIGRMGRDYKSPRRSRHSGFMCPSQNGWNYEDNDDELKEEDVWGTAASCDQYYADKIRASSTSPSATKDVAPAKASKGRKSWLSMELKAVGITGRKKEHVGVGLGVVEAVQKGGRESDGGWAAGFSSRKVQIPYCSGGGAGGSDCGNGWHRQDFGVKPGGVCQSAPMSISVWRAKCGYSEVKEGSCADDNGEDDGRNEGNQSDDEHDEGDGRLAPHEIVDREYARSQAMTFSVIEGAGRTLKGMDLRRVRNAVWSSTGFED